MTVPAADTVRDFYRDVVGWTSSDVVMDGYSDYVMNQPLDKAPTTGVCWSRGANDGLPPVWLVYFVVGSLERSLTKVRQGGGAVLREPTTAGNGRYAVVRDPAGAVCALYEAAG